MRARFCRWTPSSKTRVIQGITITKVRLWDYTQSNDEAYKSSLIVKLFGAAWRHLVELMSTKSLEKVSYLLVSGCTCTSCPQASRQPKLRHAAIAEVT